LANCAGIEQLYILPRLVEQIVFSVAPAEGDSLFQGGAQGGVQGSALLR
jgi:hypothetical protein